MKKNISLIVMMIVILWSVGAMPGILRSQTPPPGSVITASTTFDSDLDLTGIGFTGIVYTIGASNITIDGAGHRIIAPDAQNVFYINHIDNVILKNFVIEADPTAAITGYGVSKYLQFENLDLKGNGAGVAITIPIYSRDIQVLNCTATGWETAVNGGWITEVVLQGNRFTGNNVAVGLGTSKYIQIIENDFSNSNDWAVYMTMDYHCANYYGGDPLIIQNNDFTDCQNGIWLACQVEADVGVRLSGIDFSSFNIVDTVMYLWGANYVVVSDMNFSNTTGSRRGTGLVLLYCTDCVLERCVISGRDMGLSLTGRNTKVINCTVADNYRGIGTHASWYDGYEFRNSILYANEITDLSANMDLVASLTYCDVGLLNNSPYVPDDGNINADPLFVDAAASDFRLNPGSPCIDAGDPLDPVPPGGGIRVDMGAYEVTNQPPIAVCKDTIIPADENGQAFITAADIDGGCYDPDEEDTFILSIDNLGPFSLGEHVVNLTITDQSGASDTCQATITVVDITPPEISMTVDPATLWPPNHKMIHITPTITVSDNCDSNPLAYLVNITMNEGDETNTYDPSFDANSGDGNTINDIQVDGEGNIFLRAERRGGGTGRTYALTFAAMDASGNHSTATATVTVPHNQ